MSDLILFVIVDLDSDTHPNDAENHGNHCQDADGHDHPEPPRWIILGRVLNDGDRGGRRSWWTQSNEKSKISHWLTQKAGDRQIAMTSELVVQAPKLLRMFAVNVMPAAMVLASQYEICGSLLTAASVVSMIMAHG